MDCIGPRYHDWSPRDPQYNFNRLQSQKTQSEFVNLSGNNNQRHKNIYQISHLKFNEIFITATATAFMDARSRITTRQQCMITSLNSCSPWGIRKQWRPGQLRRALGRDWLKTGTALDWQRQRTWNLQRNNIISFTARIILMQYLQLLSLTITRYEHYSLATPVLFLYHIKGPLHWPWNGDSLSSHGWRTPKCPSPFGWKQRNKASRSLLFIELMSKLPHERLVALQTLSLPTYNVLMRWRGQTFSVSSSDSLQVDSTQRYLKKGKIRTIPPQNWHEQINAGKIPQTALRETPAYHRSTKWINSLFI